MLDELSELRKQHQEDAVNRLQNISVVADLLSSSSTARRFSASLSYAAAAPKEPPVAPRGRLPHVTSPVSGWGDCSDGDDATHPPPIPSERVCACLLAVAVALPVAVAQPVAAARRVAGARRGAARVARPAAHVAAAACLAKRPAAPHPALA